MFDASGTTATIIGGIAGGVSGFIIGGITGAKDGFWSSFEGALIGAGTGLAAGAAAGLAVDLVPVAAVGYLASATVSSIFGFTAGSITNAFTQLAFRGRSGVKREEILAAGVGGVGNGALAPILPASTAVGATVGINIDSLVFGVKEAVCK